jgi:hypothetical protein
MSREESKRRNREETTFSVLTSSLFSLGGAEEEMNLEKVRVAIEEETKAVEKEEREKVGADKPLDEKVVTQKVTERLQKKGITTAALQGKKSQQRDNKKEGEEDRKRRERRASRKTLTHCP